jgi:peptide/nickel transport system ATP-binding protein
MRPGGRGAGHLKRCHLPDPDAVYRSEVLPEIAPDLAATTTDPAEER